MNYNDAMYYAYVEASLSPDPSSQNGIVIVRECYDGDYDIISRGHNDWPKGAVVTPERWERPTKYTFIEHSERNAIYSAAKRGVPLEGTTIVFGTVFHSCAYCSRGIVQSGIKRQVRSSKLSHDMPRWKESTQDADKILIEGGVEIVEIDFEWPKDAPILFTLKRDGKDWSPA
jgi:dCMP deaminase